MSVYSLVTMAQASGASDKLWPVAPHDVVTNSLVTSSSHGPSGLLRRSLTPGDLRSPQHRQRYSVGILLDIVDPDVVRVARRSSPAGHWLSAFIGTGSHHQMQSIMYPGSWCATWPNRDKHRWCKMSPAVDKWYLWSISALELVGSCRGSHQAQTQHHNL